MKRKVIDLEIVEDVEESGVEKISLVDSPAIDVQWFAFAEEEFIEPNPCWSGYEAYGTKVVDGREVPNCVPIQAMELESYNDYPESAVNAAKRALKYRDENPDVDCGSPIGWARANQLAKKENISQETISRMASFARHLQWKDVPYTEGCGGLMVDAWGGQAGIEWASNKLEQIQTALQKEAFIEPNPCWAGYEAYGTKMLDGREVPNCVPVQAKEMKLIEPNPCWAGYEAYGTKMLDGREVPNCVPVNAKKEKLGYDTSALPPYIEQVPKKRKLQFVNEDEQIVVGPALIPGIEISRVDPDTKEMYSVKFSEKVVRKTAEKFMRELRNKDTNIQHTDQEAGSYVMENWIVENKQDKANSFYGFNLPIGTWMVSMRVQDPATWKMVKAGKLTGFSIEGAFIDKVDNDKFKEDKNKYEKILKILGEI